MITDAHIHLSKFSNDYVDAFIAQSAGQGILRFVMAGYDSSDWHTQLQIQARFPKQVFTSFGLHPWIVPNLSDVEYDKSMIELENLCGEGKCHFIGETGLDHHRDTTDLARMKKLKSFSAHLQLASRYKKPLVLHIVKAHEDALSLLREGKHKWTGMVHGFSGAPEQAVEYVKLGFFISVGTGLLDPKYKKLAQTVDRLPLESFIVESDSPQSAEDLKPDTRWVLKIMERISTIKQIPVAQVVEVVEKNVQTLIGN